MKKTCQLYSYNSENITIKSDSLKAFLDKIHIADLKEDEVNWINFHDITDRARIEIFFQDHNYDRLTIEDVYTRGKRPKLEEYDDYLFFAIRSALPTDVDATRLKQEQISFILGKNYLISFQDKRSDHFTVVRERLTSKKGIIRDKGADFLLYRLLDAIVDNYFEVLDEMSNVVEKLEKQIAFSRDPNLPQKIEIQKRKLLELRKIVLPLKDMTLLLEAAEHVYLAKENHHYFVDLKENCYSILDEIDTNKSLLDGMSSLYYAIQSQRMNEIMKVLTVISAIFIPLTFIVGVYGMNFDNMPELHYRYGYHIIWVAMVVIAISQFIYFLKRGWLKRK